MRILGRTVLLSMLAIAPWLIGSVHVGSQMLLLGGMTLVVAIWWLDFAFFARSGKGLIPYVFVPLFLGWCLALGQTIPLSESVASWIAPTQLEVYQEYTGNEESTQTPITEDSSSVPVTTRLTLDFDQTRQHAGLLVLAMGCMLTGSYFFKSRGGPLALKK